MILARFVCVFACVVIAHCHPPRHPTNEELSVKNSHYNNKDFIKDIKKEIEDYLEEEDAKSINERVIDQKTEHKHPVRVAILNSDKSEHVSTDDVVSEKVHDEAEKKGTEKGEIHQTVKESPVVEQKSRVTHTAPINKQKTVVEQKIQEIHTAKISKQNPVVEQKYHETHTAPISKQSPVVEQKSLEPQITLINKQSEKVYVKDKKVEDEKIEKAPTKLNVKDRPDIDTIVTVFNNQIGVDKKYYFKTLNREEGDERYRCKVGFTSGDVIFYYRCLLVR